MAVAAVAGWLDWRKGEIPNWLTFPAMGIAPILHVARFTMAKQPMEGALMEGAFSIGGAALCAIVPMILYRQSAIGGGDVKLLIALGALLQPLIGVEAQMYGFFAGAFLAPAKLAYEGKLIATLKNAFVIGGNLFLPAAKRRSVDAAVLSWFRLGPAIALGTALACYLHW
jgi:prepilin peptidase CpaA